MRFFFLTHDTLCEKEPGIFLSFFNESVFKIVGSGMLDFFEFEYVLLLYNNEGKET